MDKAREQRGAALKQIFDAVDEWATKAKSEWFPDFGDKEWRKTQWFGILKRLGGEAANTPGLDLDDLDWKYLDPIERFVSSLRFAVSGYEFDGNTKVWRHAAVDARSVKKGTQKYLDQSALEDAVLGYLDLPVRCQQVDSLLVDMLVHCEFAQYTKAVYFDYGGAGFRRGNGPIGWLGWRLFSAVIFIGPAALLAWLANGEWADWVGLILVSLFLLESAYSLFVMPFAWRAQFQHNVKVTRLLSVFNGVYRELSSHGSISPRHIREVAQAATLEGVVWPSSLFLLLDDVIAREGRL